MALLDRMTKKYITVNYTHKGLYAGVVPIYMILDPEVDYEMDGELFITERNWIPEGSIVFVRFIWRLMTVFFPRNPPVYVTGKTTSDEL